MPVSIDDFESGELPGEPSVPEQVLASLYSHRDLAFKRSEIAAGIDEDSNAVGTALTRLKDRDLVRLKGAYWAITDDLERLTAAYDLHTATERLDGEDGGINTDAWEAGEPDAPHPSERDNREIQPHRGDVVPSSDPFKLGTGRQRPLLIVNNDSHPFRSEQFVAVAISRREYENTLALGSDVWEVGGCPS
jgi:hypothetical protein